MLERDQPLTPQDRQFYDQLVATMRSDHRQVHSVTDLWEGCPSPPPWPKARRPCRQRDGAACGDAGHIGGRRRRGSSPSDGGGRVATGRCPRLRHGPGSTIADEFSAIDRQMLGITAATIVLILVLLLLCTGRQVVAAIPLIWVGLGLAVARPSSRSSATPA